ncbi:MAG: aminotransferase class III-fold pyridoxal phosphate-dependent enzyme [Flavobacteriaceae bacterium]|nr:aminotransferase class III-fold pyridoxal phosphate-dependent enzyme [Flavobacteriaceae bacterium]
MELFDVYPLYQVCPVKAEGIFVYDNKGKKYLDLYGGHAVIAIGHSHPRYVKAVQEQVAKLGFYSNAIINPLQSELAQKLGKLSGCNDYQLFLCNSGAEANENALKLASFATGKKKVIAFKNGFHGRTSAAVAVTDNQKIQAPINKGHEVILVDFDDEIALEAAMKQEDVAAVILECIQGVGGLHMAQADFYRRIQQLCKQYGVKLIADEIQSGYGRTGKFFAFQHFELEPDIISVAKGMGNGFPIGGILVHSDIKAWHGMLGTTFGGNHLACAAALAVLETIEDEKLMENVRHCWAYMKSKLAGIPEIKGVRGMGLMLGLVFDFEVASLRKELIHTYGIFTGGATDKKLLRILPPLNVKEKHLDIFLDALQQILAKK